MKTLFTIIGVCIVVIATILPNTASASYWNVTFTAERVTQVGMVDDGETIFQGDPDLFFAMQIYVQGSYQGNEVTQIFFQDSYVSTTDWNFQDKEVSLTNVFTSSTFSPTVLFSFWLYDDDYPLGAPDLLGVDSFSSESSIASESSFNDNFRWASLPIPLTSDGSGWQHNYILDYSVSIEAVPVPPAVWLFGSGLLGLIGVARRKVRV